MNSMDHDTRKMSKDTWFSATDNQEKKLIGSDNNLKTATPKTNPEPLVNTFEEKVAGEQMKQ